MKPKRSRRSWKRPAPRSSSNKVRGNTELRCPDGGWRAGALVRAAAANVYVNAFARIGFAVAGKADAAIPSKCRDRVTGPASAAGNGRVNENIQF